MRWIVFVASALCGWVLLVFVLVRFVFLSDWDCVERCWPLCWCFLYDFHGEFDPGSGRTLAACLTHASRTERPLRGYSSGERVSNTWVICPQLWDKPGKLGLIPDMTTFRMGCGGKLLRLGMGPRPISLLVG